MGKNKSRILEAVRMKDRLLRQPAYLYTREKKGIMRAVILLLLAFSLSAFSVCPLDLTPSEACSEDNPICTLYTDTGGDALCDNPEPAATEVEDTVSAAVEDTVATDTADISEEIIEPDSALPEEIPEIQEAGPVDTIPEYTPEEIENTDVVSQSDDTTEEQISQGADDSEFILTEVDHSEADSVSVTVTGGSTVADTVITEHIEVTFTPCPLKLTPEEACPEDDPRCTFFSDADSSGFCDNPEGALTVTEVITVDNSSAYALETGANGCPLELTPETACPSPDSPLCPHYTDDDCCANPSGEGIRRTLIVLAATFLLLTASSLINHFVRGRTKEIRKRRKLLHFLIQMVSFLILGFFVQACYCPLGTMQYLLLPGELGFLGGMGISILVLPIVWALFFGRIYCGWVCPFGVLQDFLGKLAIPRPPKFPSKFHRYLVLQKYVLTLLFFIAVFLAGKGVFGSMNPAALFCQIDPFHTIFSFFIVGSFIGAVLMLLAMLFFPRFFCKYFCFYGAILSLFSRHNYYHETRRESPHKLPSGDSKKEDKDKT